MMRFIRYNKVKYYLILIATAIAMGAMPVRADEAPPDTAAPAMISAVNPGYKVDGVAEVGEMIELTNLRGAELDLTGYALAYTNGNGNRSILFEFPEGAKMLGEKLHLSYKKSPGSEEMTFTYGSSLALAAGPLELIYDDEVVDAVCWTGKAGCVAAFKSAAPTTLVRDPETNEFAHVANYEWSVGGAEVLIPAPAEPAAPEETEEPENSEGGEPATTCRNVEFSEVLSYFATSNTEQFIEFYNSGDEAVSLVGCSLRYKKKTYALNGEIAAGGYFSYYPGEAVTLTKNPTKSNELELISRNGALVDKISYPHGQKKSASYARFYDGSGTETWAITYHPTPSAANEYQEYQTCPAGKVINTETGNCVKATAIATGELAECPAGKYRNPETGRCKKIETETAAKPCAEGYERNPTTNRCRKVTAENDGAEFALVPTTRGDNKTFTGIWIVIAIAGAGITYVVLQFRREMARAARKVRQRLHHAFKNLISRKIGPHGNKEA